MFHEAALTEGDPLAARAAALTLLQAVLGNKQPFSEALERDKNFNALSSRDKAFCRMITATTLRRLGQINDLIAKAETKPGAKNLALENILRIGVAQIMFMNVPDHAAVDTAVRLAEAGGMERQKGFVNGLLRTMARVGKDWLLRQDEGRLNTPEWLLKEWIDDYGLKVAAQIARANLAEAPLDITVKDPADKNHWSAAMKATELGTGTLRIMNAGRVEDLPGFAEGAWWAQDASAAMPARLLGDVRGKTVVDLCAAPGGKTLQLASMGANVIALDRSAQRLKRLEENLKRMGLASQVKIIATDAGEWRPPEAPQFILLDAPCSATGTIRRNPDVPHFKSRIDQDRLTTLQAEILDHAFEVLAPGGVLVYCVCSLQKAEGEGQIHRLLEKNRNAIKLGVTSKEIGGLEEPVTEEGDLRILPSHMATIGGMDGFFISRITKSA